MGAEFALQGIPVRVNAISPGVFASEMTASAEVLAVTTQSPPTGALLPAPVRRAGRWGLVYSLHDFGPDEVVGSL